MKFLTARAEELDKAESRKMWSDRVRTLSPLVQQLLDSVGRQKYSERVYHCRYQIEDAVSAVKLKQTG